MERQLKALREGPKPLAAKQIAALSGIVYRAFAEGLENNPGLTVERLAQSCRGKRSSETRQPSPHRQERCGAASDLHGGTLRPARRRHAAGTRVIVTDDDSRWQVIEAVARDLTEGVKKLARNADGDFSP